MDWPVLIPVLTAWACAFTAWFIAFRAVRRRRRAVAARIVVLDEQRRAREHDMTLTMTRYVTREWGASMPPPQTAEQWAAARDKAKNALLGFLDATQWNDYILRQYFDVKGQSGALYRIWGTSYVGNIEVLVNDQGSVTQPYRSVSEYDGLHAGSLFCVHLPARYGTDFPIEDHLLAQALMLKTSESELLAIAHRYN